MDHPSVPLRSIQGAPIAVFYGSMALDFMQASHWALRDETVPIQFRGDAIQCLEEEMRNCLALSPEVWRYGNHPWLLLDVASWMEGERLGEAISGSWPIGLEALRTALSSGAVTFGQCCTHPSGSIRTLAIRWAARLPESLRRG